MPALHSLPSRACLGAVGLLALALALPARGGRPPAPPRPPAPTPEAALARIVGEALTSDEAYRSLGELTDQIGSRPSGSPQLDQAVAWAQARMKEGGLSAVRAEPVTVPVWVRGAERAALVAPVERPLSMLGLGHSVGTPPGGITADAVVVESFEALGRLPAEAVRGRIVVFDVPYAGYGETVRYRAVGASMAARAGAVAALVRSIGPVSYDTPHTGTLVYQPDAPAIPAAALTIEDAALLHRISARGQTPRIHLEMAAHEAADAASANVVGELPGRERPDEIVLLGAHLDSWDVGQGAQDDGVGVVEAIEAARLLRRLGLSPRRTLRVVLFTNEESGLAGGKAYLAAHRAELSRHLVAIESDSGGGPMQSFSIELRPPVEGPAPPEPAGEARLQALYDRTLPRFARVAQLLLPLEVTLKRGHSGADLGPLLGAGVLGVGAEHDTSHYFDVHHTRADTLDKIDARAMRRNVAVITAFAYLAAELL